MKGKKKINLIDIIVIVLVLFLIFAAYYKFIYQHKSSASVSMDTLQYELEVVGVRSFTADSYHIDDTIYDGKTGTEIGVIKNIQVNPAYDYLTRIDGKIIKSVKPDRANIVLTVEVAGVESETSYLAHGNRPINVGSKQNVMTRYMNQDAEIIRVKNLGK